MIIREKLEFMKNKLSTTTSQKPPLILGIDTSCDETSAAVSCGRVILSNVVASQIDLHQEFGGVFPTLAKRAHQENIEVVVKKALKQAQTNFEKIDAIAVTLGPGLAPALEVGIKYAQKLGAKFNKPVLTINHIEAHALSVLAERNSHSYNIKKPATLPAWLPENLGIEFPILSVVVSGGHTEFILINKIGKYQILGQTIDDAAGEALDKVGRMLNLGYPAAPAIEKLAKKGDKNRFKFPLPMTTKKNFNLSYSGLKTSAHRLITELKEKNQWDQQTIIDFAASFQQAVFRHLAYKLNKLLTENKQIKQIWLGGGVSQNIAFRRQMRKVAREYKLDVKTPFAKRLCSDNAAMIALVGNFHFLQQRKNQKMDRKPNWRITKI